jgi:hypothetical protein
MAEQERLRKPRHREAPWNGARESRNLKLQPGVNAGASTAGAKRTVNGPEIIRSD